MGLTKDANRRSNQTQGIRRHDTREVRASPHALPQFELGWRKHDVLHPSFAGMRRATTVRILRTCILTSTQPPPAFSPLARASGTTHALSCQTPNTAAIYRSVRAAIKHHTSKKRGSSPAIPPSSLKYSITLPAPVRPPAHSPARPPTPHPLPPVKGNILMLSQNTAHKHPPSAHTPLPN